MQRFLTNVSNISLELSAGHIFSKVSAGLLGNMRGAFILSLFFFFITTLILYKAVLIASTSFSTFWTAYGFIVSLYLISRIPYAYLYEDNHEASYPDSAYPSVSIIVAAKNEEAGIFKTIESCVRSEYPGELECIVVDDGSTDGTHAEIEGAQKKFGGRVELIAFDKNRGKREAMTAGIYRARHEILVFVDSDSYLSADGIRHITEHFLKDAKIGAVSGNTNVENHGVNLLTKMQSIQYAISFGIYKTCESVHRSVTCCPGCFSAYRRDAIRPLIEKWKGQRFLGARGTFGDDRSLTNFVLQKWDVVYCEKARATTMVPEKLSVYWLQQLRWKKSWIREGVFAGRFMWRRHPLASLGFYIHFSFPFLGPVLAAYVLLYSITVANPFLFLIFMSSFVVIGLVFSLFMRWYRDAEYWMYMPFFSLFFITALIWQMPYAILTVRNIKWGTR